MAIRSPKTYGFERTATKMATFWGTDCHVGLRPPRNDRPISFNSTQNRVRMSSRGAKRRGDLLVLRSSSHILPGDCHGPTALAMTGGWFLRIRRSAVVDSLHLRNGTKAVPYRRKIVFGKSPLPSTAVLPRCMQVCTGIFHKTPQLYLCIHPKLSCKTPIFLKKGNNCAILFGRILESFPNFRHS